MTSNAYDDGLATGKYMKKQRAQGNYDYDVRFDLADAAKHGAEYFNEFEQGLTDGLGDES